MNFAESLKIGIAAAEDRRRNIAAIKEILNHAESDLRKFLGCEGLSLVEYDDSDIFKLRIKIKEKCLPFGKVVAGPKGFPCHIWAFNEKALVSSNEYQFQENLGDLFSTANFGGLIRHIEEYLELYGSSQRQD